MPAFLLLSLALTASSQPLVGPLTARDEVVALQVIDGADFICNAHPRFHVELLDAVSGEKKADLTGWSELLGELADGALVVTNESVPRAKALKVGVLERTGALRFSCEVPFEVHPYQFSWTQSEAGLEANAYKVRAPSGVAQPPDPDAFVQHLFRLSLGAKSCELVISKKPFQGKQTNVPGPKLGGLELETRQNGPYIDTVLLRGEKVAWRRHTSFVPVNCNLP
jgi:hypothetical protein